MFNNKVQRKFDYVILIIVFLLMVIGIVALVSATQAFSTGDTLGIQKQIIWIVASMLIMILVSKIDYEILGGYSFWFYLAIMLMLIGVLFTPRINGARSWFDFGFFSIQPGELAKIALIVSLAKHIDRILSKDQLGINNLKNIIMLALHVCIPVSLIMIQPDFGTAMVIVAIICSMVFIANVSFKFVGTVAISGVLGIGLLRYMILRGNNLFFDDYQAKRIRVFFDPTLDPTGSGYHVIQSKLAIGSGQLYGMGLFKGTQTQLGNIPEKTTDFIFSVIGEELGFIVCTIVVMLFVLLLLRFIHVAKESKDMYGTLIVVGVTAMIGVHVMVNIGMTMGLIPVTGIPLPFMSYGGSSLLTNMMGIGLVMSVASKIKK